jgi:carbamate kinase
VAITHGNGPQVGLLALQNAGSEAPYPLDILGAESDGMIGYLLERELMGRLPPDHLLATLLTQVSVSLRDPAFRDPSKPIGPTYDEAKARQMAVENGWTIRPDGKGWRRVVPSPRPKGILEARAIELLFDLGVSVICGGGGGIPVAESATGELTGVEAVVDKDHVSALIARLLRADMLLLLTDVDAVYSGWGTADQHAVDRIAAGSIDLGAYPAGSMRPKIEAAAAFVNETGRPAAIGSIEDVEAIIRGEKGTRIVPGREGRMRDRRMLDARSE